MKPKCLIPLGLMLLCACSQNTKVTIAATDVCFPKRYLPAANPYIELVTRGLPDGSEVLIYVPAAEVQQAIPAYVPSHPNQYTPAVMHDLNLILSPTRVDFSHLAKEAWGARTSGLQHFIEPDTREGYTRVYLHSDQPTFMWQMTLTPPPELPDGSPPAGWHVGPCLERLGSYSCKLLGGVTNISFTFDIEEHNLALREEVIAHAEALVQSWITACDA